MTAPEATRPTFSDAFKEFRTPKQIVRDALNAELLTCLLECTPAQQELFGRLYPGAPTKIKDDDIPNAVDLVHRTLAKNKAGRM